MVEDGEEPLVPLVEADATRVAKAVGRSSEQVGEPPCVDAKFSRTSPTKGPEVRPEGKLAASVEEAAQLLDLDPSDMRDMIARWELERNSNDRIIRALEERLPPLVRRVVGEEIAARLGADQYRGKTARLLSVEEVSEQCGVTQPTVREWIKHGGLPALRLGGGRTYRVRAEDLGAFLLRKRPAGVAVDDGADVERIVQQVGRRMARKTGE